MQVPVMSGNLRSEMHMLQSKYFRLLGKDGTTARASQPLRKQYSSKEGTHEYSYGSVAPHSTGSAVAIQLSPAVTLTAARNPLHCFAVDGQMQAADMMSSISCGTSVVTISIVPEPDFRASLQKQTTLDTSTVQHTADATTLCMPTTRAPLGWSCSRSTMHGLQDLSSPTYEPQIYAFPQGCTPGWFHTCSSNAPGCMVEPAASPGVGTVCSSTV